MAMKKLPLISFLNYGFWIPSPEPIATPTPPVWLWLRGPAASGGFATGKGGAVSRGGSGAEDAGRVQSRHRRADCAASAESNHIPRGSRKWRRRRRRRQSGQLRTRGCWWELRPMQLCAIIQRTHTKNEWISRKQFNIYLCVYSIQQQNKTNK